MQLEEEGLQAVGKLESVQSATGGCDRAHVNHRLCVRDMKSGLNFLVDSGANVSVLPRKAVLKCNNASSASYKLYAANGTEITTYGTHILELDLNLRRAFRWLFTIADVQQPILGADFLANHKLLIDLNGRRLVDQVTNLSTRGNLSSSTEPTVKTIVDNCPYYELLSKFPDLTKPISYKETPRHSVCHQIETTGPPVHARARQLPPDRYVKAKNEFRVMQELGICRPSHSAWASPLHVVPKKNGNIRPCGDYRRLNAITKPDRYPVPRLHDFTYILANKKVFTKLDINRAYNCIPVAENDIEKTAVITPFGLFEFTRMPFGLRNAAQTFQRFMHHNVLKGLDFLFNYVDDVIIASENETQHKQHLEKVFERFNEYGITINFAKCSFGKEKLEFLGYEVSVEGIRPLEDKVTAIINYPKPQTVEELRRFLGMLNFYRASVPRSAEHQTELNKYLGNSKRKDKTEIKWTELAERNFEQCKEDLKNAVLLSYPSTDNPLALMTDASDKCVGAVLQQNVNNSWKPLGYYSKKLTEAQMKYSTYDRELLAIYLAVIHFRNMVEGQELIIYTDHKPLSYAFNKTGTNRETSRRARQIMFISEFSTDIRHISGNDNIVADSLSRVATISCPTTLDFSELAAAQETDAELAKLQSESNNNNSVLLKRVILFGTDKYVVCEMSSNIARPYLTGKFRRLAFDTIHNLSHPGIKTSRKLVSERYFWPNMNKDVGNWAKTCIRCQKAKVQKHTFSDLGTFDFSKRFEHIHADIIGPLPITPEGFRYCLTVVDRFTRWPEAFPIKEITAEIVAKTIYDGWISRYGCPVKLTSDQGRQFESCLFKEIMSLMGIEKTRTTPYHPQCNGAVERMHRSLKTALKARLDTKSWVDELPTVMLGLRTTIRSDTGVTAAQMLYGSNIRVPGDFYDVSNVKSYDDYSFVEKLKNVIDGLKPSCRENKSPRKIFVHKDLETSDYVFIRNDAVRKPLQPPYDGPYRVINRKDKVYRVQLPDRQTNVSIDRLKPAYLLIDNESTSEKNDQQKIDKTNITESKIQKKVTFQTDKPSSDTYTTRTGRVSKRPIKYR